MTTIRNAEVWKDIPDYEGAYQVSDLGRVRSLDRVVSAGPGRSRLSTGRVLSLYLGDRYAKVRLKINGRGRTCNVHQLVALAFLGPCPDGREVCHNNGVHHDNALANLRYDTHSKNQLDTVRLTGTAWTRRTHCDRGHPFSEDNTRIRVGGARMCRTCDKTVWRPSRILGVAS